MKIIIAINAMLLMCIFSFAQTEKGTVSVGLSMDAKAHRVNYYNSRAAYFFKDGFSVGLEFGTYFISLSPDFQTKKKEKLLKSRF